MNYRPEDIDELLSACQAVWAHLKLSHETEYRNAVYETPAQVLRRTANEMEEKDLAILRFRQAFNALVYPEKEKR